MTTTTYHIEELNKVAAYIKNQPITEPSQMTKKIECNPMDESWLGRLAENNHYWFTGYTGKMEEQFSPADLVHYKNNIVLRDKILQFGGEQVCMPFIEEDCKKILERGQLWYGDRIKMMKGQPIQCHRNSANLWESNHNNPDVKILLATGYALSKNGMWRQHSWLVLVKPRGNQIIETTVEREAYFGFVMTDEEASYFAWENE